MGIVKPVLLTAIFTSVFAGAHALAQQEERPPSRPAVAEKTVPPPDPKKLPRLHPRRAVQQQVYTMPPGPAPVDTYRPVLAPPAPLPPGPVILNGCLNGVCSDPAGRALHGGVGTTLLDGKGRTCVQGPVTAQCF